MKNTPVGHSLSHRPLRVASAIMDSPRNFHNPRGWLSEALFERARRRIAAGRRLAVAAYTVLRDRANKALQAPIESLRDLDGSPHFRQDGVYVPDRDGVVNEKADRRSGDLVKRFSRHVLDLALAYRISGHLRYLHGALDRVHAWCINENTMMWPDGYVFDSATPGQPYGGDIVLFAGLADAFLAIALLRNDPAWDLAAQSAVLRWIRHMVEPQRRRMFYEGREMTNNWEDARLLYLCFGACALDDLDLLLEVFERWRSILPLKMTDEGELPRETMRTRSMHYTLFALDSMTLVAEMSAGFGVDLYDHAINGRGLRLALSYAARYMLDMSSWPFPMLEPLKKETLRDHGLASFELAYRHWKDPLFLRVIRRWDGRPVTDHHATLLHGRF